MTIKTDMVVDHSRHSSDITLSSEARFKRRINGEISAAVAKLLEQRNVTNLTSGGQVAVPVGGTVKFRVHEPTFRYDQKTGNPEFVLVGNPFFKRGDIIPKPSGGGAQGGSGPGAGQGESEDDFVFQLDEKEFAKYLMEGLGLPNLKLKKFHLATTTAYQRTGLQTDGPPAMLDLGVTVRRAMGRRKALRRPDRLQIEELENQLAELQKSDVDGSNAAGIEALRLDIDELQRRRKIVPYFDPDDLRFRRNTIITRPVTKAVMFALMDRSGSMGQHHKNLAKQFFWLLKIFLRQQYDLVDVVWIAHTDVPKEVTEEEFFFGQATGGTVVSSALELMLKVREDRYPLEEYNVFCCQAGDGDTWVNNQGEDDAEASCEIVKSQVLNDFQYFAYIECLDSGSITGDSVKDAANGVDTSPLWQAYSEIERTEHFAMRQVSDPEQIYPVFRNLFSIRGDKPVAVA